ncbi:helix-turn-helix transcriptional regulator [[Actinomadura] parvosata]|uniref:helix-turn-helix transcriptional regulator n=1 Tax=[Actinomadura] parvosata TaxID=1955412 RepID=UPI0012BCF18F|nr:LuxR C-terminal-related transcriptional regulator [Nonomuraea sp. ATCC 55076]
MSLTSFVGRQEQVDKLLTLLSSRRLVSLTGVGGCGKTRLALRVAESLAASCADGPWMVDLSAVKEPEQVGRLVASAFDLLLEPGGDQLAGLVRQLAHRETLLLLDTCEHLLAPVAELTDRLLRSCPGLTVLATTREPLGVEGETVWRVPVLDAAEARQLFAERATLVAPGFDLRAVEADVDAVCTRVDRLPLGIELAAAWVRALGPAQIASGLEDSARLLTGGPRGGVARHRTLNASIGWSHALLDRRDQVLFRRLAAFAGTFDIDAVAAVCAGPGAPVHGSVDGRGREAALPVDWLQPLGRLLDKSLVTVREVAGQVRYRLLDTIQQYAEEELRAAGEEDAVLERHLDHFLRLAEEAEPGLDFDQDTWRLVLDGHHDNLVKALRWGFAGGPARRAKACRMVAALGRYWFLRGLSTEGHRFFDLALRCVEDRAVRHRLLAGQAMLAMVSGRGDLLDDAVSEVLDDPAPDPVSRVRSLTARSFRVFFRDFEETERLAREACHEAERVGDPFCRDWALVTAGYSLQTRGLNDEARKAARRAHAGSVERGDRFCAAFARGIEVFTTMQTGDVRAAVAIADEVVALVRPLRDYFAVGTNTVNAAHAIASSGDLDRARELIDPVVRSVVETEDVNVVGFMVADGLVRLWSGELEAAVRTFERGVRRRADGSIEWIGLRCLPGLVGALRRLDRLESAVTIAKEGVELAERLRTPYELAQLLDELGRLAAPADRGQARDLLHRSLALRHDHGLVTSLVDSLEALAELDAGEDVHRARAARLLGACEAARERMGYPRPPVDAAAAAALIAGLRDRLGAGFDEHRAAGRDLTLADAVELARRGRGSRDRPSAGWESLSPTEREVVVLVCAGLSNPDVAGRLFMSRSTVKSHLSRIYQKLGVANRTELAAYASSHPDPGS